jgi:hypothetical protein
MEDEVIYKKIIFRTLEGGYWHPPTLEQLPMLAEMSVPDFTSYVRTVMEPKFNFDPVIANKIVEEVRQLSDEKRLKLFSELLSSALSIIGLMVPKSLRGRKTRGTSLRRTPPISWRSQSGGAPGEGDAEEDCERCLLQGIIGLAVTVFSIPCACLMIWLWSYGVRWRNFADDARGALAEIRVEGDEGDGGRGAAAGAPNMAAATAAAQAAAPEQQHVSLVRPVLRCPFCGKVGALDMDDLEDGSAAVCDMFDCEKTEAKQMGCCLGKMCVECAEGWTNACQPPPPPPLPAAEEAEAPADTRPMTPPNP